MPETSIVNQPQIIDTEPGQAESTKGQWWQRGVRTVVQVGLVQIVLQTYQAFAAVPLNEQQYAALTTLLTTLLTIAQILAEDIVGMALLRTPQGRPRRRPA